MCCTVLQSSGPVRDHAIRVRNFLLAVIKPVYGAASIGVVKVEDMAGLKRTYKRVAKEMAGARIVDGAMQAGAADDDETDQVGVQSVQLFLSQVVLSVRPRRRVAHHRRGCATEMLAKTQDVSHSRT